MFHKIASKVLFLFVINVVVWVSFLGVFFYFLAAESLETQVDDTLKRTATVLASQWDATLLLPLRSGMEETPLYRSFVERLKLLKQRTNLEGIHLASLDSRCLVSTDQRIVIGQSLPRLDLLRYELNQAKRGEVATSALIRANGRMYKSAIAPVYAADTVAAVLVIDMSPSYLGYLKSFRHSLLFFTAIALICCAVSARLFSRTITTPISTMVERVEQIGKAQYEKPLEVTGRGELAKLAESIESMRQNIRRRDVQMKMMLSGIAHEIRNPLGGMELFTGILERENLTSHQRDYVRKVDREIQNLKYLLNEFLEFAAPKTLALQNVRVEELIAEIRGLMQNEVEARKAEWKLEPLSVSYTIQADRLRLKQALLNLYRNALQALPQEGGEIRSRITRNGSGLLIEIRNSQKGPVAQELEKKIFEPFFTTKEKGIGLGLPLAKNIIEAHQGELHLIENNASFISFLMKLPIRQP